MKTARVSVSPLVRTICLVVIGMLFTKVKADDWPHWRGLFRNDVSAESSGWDGKSWIKGELWRATVGLGSSSPLVVGPHVYFVGWSDNQDSIYCFDVSTGEEIWRQSYPSPLYGRFAVGDQALYSGACSTPECDTASGLLFTLGVDGDVNAWDTNEDGKHVWALNLHDRYQVSQRPEVAKRKRTQRDYGYTSSPLVVGEQLIIEVGAKEGNLISLNKHDGTELWRSENRDEAGHTGGPVPITVEGESCAAVLTLRNLVVTEILGPNAGKTVATYPWTTDYGNNIATAAVAEQSVIVTSAYNHSAMCRIGISLDGASKMWETDGVASGVCSPLVHKGYVYWAWRGVHCVDLETGVEVWVGGKVGSQGSCIVTSDDRLIVYANNGDLTLVETAGRSPHQYTELASYTALSKTDAWPHVVLSDGRLLCRDRDGNVCCLAVKQ
ncbi:outer membrane biogenesis protein BamB [Rubripirellula amarantea]|uniref:Outer membrane biogenesis protein BamB n=1 Tax=Rubripirellula amarantea TaxID=2527999 RepID=A0A5C5WNE1_9BACT|nr:PQQ-binding-like beta-propeller repeat protein [Rubripirellula amarantea]TWT51342.1 outer membrane biogenesis protein BamB [Rubripirellula amarantea]